MRVVRTKESYQLDKNDKIIITKTDSTVDVEEIYELDKEKCDFLYIELYSGKIIKIGHGSHVLVEEDV